MEMVSGTPIFLGQIQDMILKRVSSLEIRRKARKLGMRTLRETGWEKVKQGVTTPEEVLRVTEAEEIIK